MSCGTRLSSVLASAEDAVSHPAFLPMTSTIVTDGTSYTKQSHAISVNAVAINLAAEPNPGQ